MSRRVSAQEQDFGDILRNGLNSNRSYVVLKQKSRSPVFLQFRPFIHRLTNSVLYIGGKLSAFPDTSHEKWTSLEGTETRVGVLKAAWKKLPQDRVDDGRVGSNAGFLVAAGGKNGKLFATKFGTTHLIHNLLMGIEEALNIEIDNKDDVKGYLNYYYGGKYEQCFNNPTNVVNLKERQVGKRSELLLGQEFTGLSPALVEFQKQYELDGITGEVVEDDEEAA